jgi:N-acetyl-beta-hexosaminidase
VNSFIGYIYIYILEVAMHMHPMKKIKKVIDQLNQTQENTVKISTV